MSKSNSPAQPGAPGEAGFCPHGVQLRADGSTECPICRAERAERLPASHLLRNWIIVTAAIVAVALLGVWLM